MITPVMQYDVLRHDSPALVAALEKYKERIVYNGVLSGTGNHPNASIAIATIAAYNEFGTPNARYPIPARPFMRTAYKRLFGKHRSKIVQALYSSLVDKSKKNIRRNPKAKEFFGYCGELIKTLMQQNIKHSKLLFAKNADFTIEQKGSDQPLFDEGILFKSLSYDVRRNS